MLAVVELSTGQLVDDVRLAVEGRRPVEFYGRVGGNVPSTEEVLAFVRGLLLRHVGTAGDKIACPTVTGQEACPTEACPTTEVVRA